MNPEESLIKISPGLLQALSTGGLQLDVLSREIVALECLVAGTSFRQLHEVEKDLRFNAKLEMKREPKNTHDAFAVALWFGKVKVGYLPRDKNETVARLMDAGKRFYALIQASEWEGNWLKLKVRVVLKE